MGRHADWVWPFDGFGCAELPRRFSCPGIFDVMDTFDMDGVII